jgi:uncharacterized protein YfkK (UPF0435 family)
MNKEEILSFMINEFETANKVGMLNGGLSEQEVEAKTIEYRPSISILLSQVLDKMFEKNIF